MPGTQSATHSEADRRPGGLLVPQERIRNGQCCSSSCPRLPSRTWTWTSEPTDVRSCPILGTVARSDVDGLDGLHQLVWAVEAGWRTVVSPRCVFFRGPVHWHRAQLGALCIVPGVDTHACQNTRKPPPPTHTHPRTTHTVRPPLETSQFSPTPPRSPSPPPPHNRCLTLLLRTHTLCFVPRLADGPTPSLALWLVCVGCVRLGGGRGSPFSVFLCVSLHLTRLV